MWFAVVFGGLVFVGGSLVIVFQRALVACGLGDKGAGWLSWAAWAEPSQYRT